METEMRVEHFAGKGVQITWDGHAQFRLLHDGGVIAIGLGAGVLALGMIAPQWLPAVAGIDPAFLGAAALAGGLLAFAWGGSRAFGHQLRIGPDAGGVTLLRQDRRRQWRVTQEIARADILGAETETMTDPDAPDWHRVILRLRNGDTISIAPNAIASADTAKALVQEVRTGLGMG